MGPLYDGDGVRVGQLVNGVATYYFMGGAYEVTGTVSGSTFNETGYKNYFAIAGQTIAMDDGSGLQYFLTDHLGSMVAVLSDDGALLSQQRYMPFGQVRTSIGSITQTDFGYTGQRNEAYIKLLDYRSRWYDPYLKQFSSPDSLIPDPYNCLDYNRYAYARSNPIRYNDPSGHMVACDNDDWACQHHWDEPITYDDSDFELDKVIKRVNDWVDEISPDGHKQSFMVTAGWGSNFVAKGKKIPTVLYWGLSFVTDNNGGFQIFYETLDIYFDPTLKLNPGEKANPSELFGIGVSATRGPIWRTDGEPFETSNYAGEAISGGGSWDIITADYYESYPNTNINGLDAGISFGAPSIWGISTYAHPITPRIDFAFWNQ